jgi:hypothetical protein
MENKLAATSQKAISESELVAIARNLLPGSIDFHIHGGPDLRPRKMSEIAIAQAAKQAGMKAVIIKNHVTPTTCRARLIQEMLGGYSVFGGLVLNKAAGGLNPSAVEVELKLGAKEIWLPTISSVAQVQLIKGSLASAVPITDQRGAFLPALIEVLDLIAQAGAILGTGHLSPEEVEKVVCLARQRKVQKIVITHPENNPPAMPLDMQQRLVTQGVFFERTFLSALPPRKITLEIMAEHIKAVGAEQTIMATDFGQAENDEPITGFIKFMKTMMAFGIPAEQIATMVQKNPAQVLEC